MTQIMAGIGAMCYADSEEPVNRGFEEINVASQDADPDSLLSHYRRLIHLRHDQPALLHGSFIPVESSCDATMAFLRQAPVGDTGAPDGQAALVVLNFGRQELTGCTFSYSGDALPAATHQMRDLLTDEVAAPLTVTANGFQRYAPLPSLAARSGLILLLEQ